MASQRQMYAGHLNVTAVKRVCVWYTSLLKCCVECVCDWNSYKCIHGNIHSTPIHQSVVSFYTDSPALEKRSTKERPHNISSLCVCVYWQPLSWLLQFQVCSQDVLLINLGLKEVGLEEIINLLGRK